MWRSRLSSPTSKSMCATPEACRAGESSLLSIPTKKIIATRGLQRQVPAPTFVKHALQPKLGAPQCPLRKSRPGESRWRLQISDLRQSSPDRQRTNCRRGFRQRTLRRFVARSEWTRAAKLAAVGTAFSDGTGAQATAPTKYLVLRRGVNDEKDGLFGTVAPADNATPENDRDDK
jgi:hypothetical protein